MSPDFPQRAHSTPKLAPAPSSGGPSAHLYEGASCESVVHTMDSELQ